MTASCGCGAIISSLFLCTRNPSNDMLPMTILWIPLKHQRYESVSVKDLARAVGAGWTGPHHDYVLALLHLPGHKAAEIFFCCPGQGVVPQKNNTYDRAAAADLVAWRAKEQTLAHHMPSLQDTFIT